MPSRARQQFEKLSRSRAGTLPAVSRSQEILTGLTGGDNPLLRILSGVLSPNISDMPGNIPQLPPRPSLPPLMNRGPTQPRPQLPLTNTASLHGGGGLLPHPDQPGGPGGFGPGGGFPYPASDPYPIYGPGSRPPSWGDPEHPEGWESSRVYNIINGLIQGRPQGDPSPDGDCLLGSPGCGPDWPGLPDIIPPIIAAIANRPRSRPGLGPIPFPRGGDKPANLCVDPETGKTIPCDDENAIGLPSYQQGGVVQETGPAIVHEGEVVIPKASQERKRTDPYGNTVRYPRFYQTEREIKILIEEGMEPELARALAELANVQFPDRPTTDISRLAGEIGQLPLNRAGGGLASLLSPSLPPPLVQESGQLFPGNLPAPPGPPFPNGQSLKSYQTRPTSGSFAGSTSLPPTGGLASSLGALQFDPRILSQPTIEGPTLPSPGLPPPPTVSPPPPTGDAGQYGISEDLSLIGLDDNFIDWLGWKHPEYEGLNDTGKASVIGEYLSLVDKDGDPEKIVEKLPNMAWLMPTGGTAPPMQGQSLKSYQTRPTSGSFAGSTSLPPTGGAVPPFPTDGIHPFEYSQSATEAYGPLADPRILSQPTIAGPTLNEPRTVLPPEEEQKFQEWYTGWADKSGVNPDPDDPEHKYDYRGAYVAGVEPILSADDNLYHWPSQFKNQDHPDRFVDGIDTITMEPVTPPSIANMPQMRRFPGGPDPIAELPLSSRIQGPFLGPGPQQTQATIPPVATEQQQQQQQGGPSRIGRILQTVLGGLGMGSEVSPAGGAPAEGEEVDRGFLGNMANRYATDPVFRNAIGTLLTGAIGGGGPAGAENIAAFQRAAERSQETRTQQAEERRKQAEEARAKEREERSKTEFGWKSKESARAEATAMASTQVPWKGLSEELKIAIGVGGEVWYEATLKRAARADAQEKMEMDTAAMDFDSKKYAHNVTKANRSIAAKISREIEPSLADFPKDVRKFLGDEVLEGIIEDAKTAHKLEGLTLDQLQAKLDADTASATQSKATAKLRDAEAKAADYQVLKGGTGQPDTLIKISTGEAVAEGNYSADRDADNMPKLTATENRNLADIGGVLRKLEEIRVAFVKGKDPEGGEHLWLGPWQDLKVGVQERIPGGFLGEPGPDQRTFRAMVNKFSADRINELAGANLSALEYKRYMTSITGLGDLPGNFEAKLYESMDVLFNQIMDRSSAFQVDPSKYLKGYEPSTDFELAGGGDERLTDAERRVRLTWAVDAETKRALNKQWKEEGYEPLGE